MPDYIDILEWVFPIGRIFIKVKEKPLTREQLQSIYSDGRLISGLFFLLASLILFVVSIYYFTKVEAVSAFIIILPAAGFVLLSYTTCMYHRVVLGQSFEQVRGRKNSEDCRRNSSNIY